MAMSRLSAVMLLLVVGACAGEAGPTPTTTTVAPTTTTTVPPTTTTTVPPPCPEAPYQLGFLPVGVGRTTLDIEEIPPEDVWTSVGGSRTTLVPRDDGTVAIALIRGTLPAVDWPADRGEVSIDGTRAVAGPHPDGTWVVGWYEEPAARCDRYTMVFYPPWDPRDVEAVLEGMVRVAG